MAYDMGSFGGRVLALCVAGLATAGCGGPGDGNTTFDSTTGLTGILTNPTTSADGTAADDDDTAGVLDVFSSSDLGSAGDCPGGGGGMMGDDIEFSYIWVANSPEGTVSKIDTRTGVEVARYATGPVGQAEPSRTSVNLYGDVAVSNRGAQGGGGGGVTKIAARLDDCVDLNANGTIETSTGPANVLPWGTDECVLWNVPIPSLQYEQGPRPTAWEGSVTQAGCASPNPRLWLGWYDYAGNRGVFHRMNGATGAIEDTVEVTPWNGLNYGPYGGAVNKDGDFWVIGWQLGPLVRIDGDTLQVERIEMPPPPADQQWSYGMSLDQYGNPWIASGGAAAVYDVGLGQWQFVSTGNLSMRGVMVDDQDRAWFAVDYAGDFGGCGLGLVDVQARTVLAPAITLPGCFTPVGVSIDVEGYVWVVDQSANQAFKVDPDTYQTLLTVSGLNAPYTYSDMTGAGLNLVVNPPAG